MTYDILPHLSSPALPLPVGYTFTGSALPVALRGVPDTYCGAPVASVYVTVVNADGVPLRVPASRSELRGDWQVVVKSDVFQTYGYISFGVKIEFVLDLGEVTTPVTVALGDLEVLKASPSAQPGTPDPVGTKLIVEYEGAVYMATNFVDGVQHYVKQTLVYDDDMAAWGASWDGDYVYVNGVMESAS